MNASIVTQVKEAIEPLAGKIQQGAEFMYGVFYRQTIIEGILMVAIPIILLIVGAIALKKFMTYANIAHAKFEKKRRSSYEDNPWTVLRPLCWLAYIGLIVASGCYMVQGTLQLANPNYYTIKRVISSVKAGGVR
jgi:hypothetical protein